MEISIAKANEIESYIKDNKEDCLQRNQLHVQLKGAPKWLDVYRLPIEMLVYNTRNGRFAAEILQKQVDLGRQLNPLEDSDRKTIQKLLLEEDEKATQLLKDNLEKVGQVEPGIITFDGVVINGNRRMSVFESLFKEKSDTQYSFLNVARLPKNVDEKDMYRLEIGIQLSRPYRKDYGPINDLLKINEGLIIGFDPKQIADTLFGGFDESEIREKIERLKLVEAYLEYIGKPKKYEEVKGWHEHFINLQNAISVFKKEKIMNAKEIHYATLAGFELIIAKSPHMDIRLIKKFMEEKKTKEGLMESVGKVIEEKNEIIETKPEELKKTEIEENIKKKKLKSQTKIANDFRESFENLKDTYKAQKEANKPKTLLKRALSNLESINPRNPNLREKEIIELLKSIAEITTKLLEIK